MDSYLVKSFRRRVSSPNSTEIRMERKYVAGKSNPVLLAYTFEFVIVKRTEKIGPSLLNSRVAYGVVIVRHSVTAS